MAALDNLPAVPLKTDIVEGDLGRISDFNTVSDHVNRAIDALQSAGAALGLATLDSTGRLVEAQLPDLSGTVVATDPEVVRDTVAAMLRQGSNVLLTNDDAGDALTITVSVPGGSGTDLGWISVKAYNAVGDGTTDDTAEIQAAFDAVPSTGGVVFFPPGIYRVSAPLQVKPYTHIVGSEPASRYWAASTANPPSACAIRVSSAFVGAALFPFPATSTANSISNITLRGDNIGSVHALDFDPPNTEHNFLMQNVAIIGFGGDGIRGRLWAARFVNFFVGGCHGWGINPTEFFADTHWVNGYVAGCYEGGMNFDGTGSSGFCDFLNVRFERSGWNSANPAAPFTVGGPGIRLVRANNCRFIACSTDANSGNGLEIVLERASAGDIYDMDFIACTFKRDGWGNFASQGEYAGVKTVGYDNAGSRVDLSRVRFSMCAILAGKATDDGGGPAYNHPKHGWWSERTAYMQWDGGHIETGGGELLRCPAGLFSDWNYRPIINLAREGISTDPLGNTASRPTGNLRFQGARYFDTTLGRPIWWNGSNWKDAAGVTV